MRSLCFSTVAVVAALGGSRAEPTATSAATALPTVDLGYSVHQATINVGVPPSKYWDGGSIRDDKELSPSTSVERQLSPMSDFQVTNSSRLEFFLYFQECRSYFNPNLINPDLLKETGAYYNFSNIRYAAPPLGHLRFAAPIPPEAQNRTVNDGQQGGICPQASPTWQVIEGQYLSGVNVSTLTAEQASSNSTLSLSDIPKPGPTETEDCLLLDVVVPEAIYNHPNAKVKRGELEICNCTCTSAPVLVWIYGGGYVVGSKLVSGNPAGIIASSRIEGSEGIIFVAMNYRLGMFGWMSGPTFQENGTANVGLYDQRLALEWVQQNIHLFGGDPNRVTVMGVSAGGGSIMHQITTYGGLKGKVPFQQAIPQSAAFLNTPGANQQEATFTNVLAYASSITNTSITILTQLRSLPSSTLHTINTVAVGLAPFGRFIFGPTVDGLFVPALPSQLLLHGQFDSSLNEALIFTSPFINTSTAFNTFVSSIAPGVTADVNLLHREYALPPNILQRQLPLH